MTERNSLTAVLVPIDTSDVAERAIPWAKAVAGTTARIVLLQVIPVATACAHIQRPGHRQRGDDSDGISADGRGATRRCSREMVRFQR